jgi:hypothetical protein
VGSGTFIVAEYYDAGILFPQERGEIYEASSLKGPFSTVSEYHSALLTLNHDYGLIDTEDYLRSVRVFRLAQPKVSLPQYENGPFVVNHDDLKSSNILVYCCLARLPGHYLLTCARQVDDDFNITGLLDFPGTIVPLSSICVNPIMFFLECYITPFTDRDLWLQSILDAQPVPGSALNDFEVRKMLMETQRGRRIFNHALHYTYAYLGAPTLVELFNLNIGKGDAEVKADGIHNA